MPEKSDHENKAQSNEEFSEKIDSEFRKYNDWIITAKFYAAVHYIDGVLSEEGIHPEKHGDRFEAIRESRSINRRSEALYQTLWDLSEQSRYKCITINPGQINSADKALSNLKSELGFS